MSRSAAAAILLSVLATGSAFAGDRAPATPAPPTSTPAAPAATRGVPADATARAKADRADPLSRSVFWAREAEIDPSDPIAGVKVSQALREMGQFEQAAATAEQILQTQPNNVEAMLEIGRAHIARGQAFYGIAPLEQAHALAPNDWRPLSLLGVAYTQVRRVEDGRTAWNEGLQLSKDNPDILTNAAMALTTQGDAPGAEALLRRAVAQPTATLKTKLNLALVLGVQGNMAEAEQIIRRALPPEEAERNLTWLRDKASPTVTASNTGSPAGRTWSSLQSN
ncbi:tetratricopeptide repeat protein [soil metagenome]